MKILLVSNYTINGGGISSQVMLLKKNLIREGKIVDVFSTKNFFLKRIALFFKLLLKAKNFDVLHAHGCSYWGFLPIVYTIIAGKINKKKTIVTYHGGEAEKYLAKYGWFARFFLKRADHIIVLSAFLEKIFKRKGFQTFIIPNILEEGNIPYEKRDLIEPNFISVRSLEPLYNIDLIIDAFFVVRQKLPNAKLTILSTGSQEKALKEKCRLLKLDDVVFLGQVPNNEIHKHLKNNSIMVSSPFIDNMPVSILEAFSSGLLVISSNVGGVPYLVQHGRNGYLFESNNKDDLVEKMLYAIDQNDKSLEIIRTANEQMSAYYWPSIKKSIFVVYGL